MFAQAETWERVKNNKVKVNTVMKICWAESLGNCSGKASREHIVSRNLFEGETVEVCGFSWCKNEEKEISLSSLTSKILCIKHNNELSEVDEAGGIAFKVLREMTRLSNVREKMKPRIWHIVKHNINGLLLERWFLKTLVNISFNKEYPIGKLSHSDGMPTKELVEIIFGIRGFNNRAGLYMAAHVGQKIDSCDKLIFSPLIKDNSFIIGGLFSFRGSRFLIFLEPEGPPERLTGVGLPGDDWSNCQLNFHNEKIRLMQGKHLSQLVNIRW